MTDAKLLKSAMALNGLNQRELAEKMGQRSREIALTKYDVHEVNKHMMTEMGLI